MGGIAHAHAREALRNSRLHGLELSFRNNYPPHRGTLLASLDGHFFDDLLDKKIKLRGSSHGIGAQHRSIQRVRLKVKRHAKFAEAARRLEAVARCIGSREGHHILTLHSIQ